MRQNWPQRLWLVRHGQSQGNVARDAADEAGSHEIDIDLRDVDVPLSDLGFRQAEAAGRPVIEFSQATAVRRFLRKTVADPERGQPVENPELTLAQPLIEDRPGRAAGQSPLPADDLSRLLCADVG